MGIARSTCYENRKGSADDTALVETMHAIKDEFEAYGWRRMQAALRHRGWVVNHKKIRRLMREHAMHPPCRRRFVATTDSDHDEPVFPDRSRDCEIRWPEPALGRRSDIHRDPRRLRLPGRDHGCVVAPHHRLRARPTDRRAADACSAGSGDREPQPATRLHPPLGQRLAIRRPGLPGPAPRTRPGRLDGTARQPLRQRHDGEMEWTPPTPDAERSEGPGGPSWADGIKVLKGKIRSLPRPTEGAR